MGVVALDLSEGAVTRRLLHGEVVVRQGDAVSSLFLVTAGAVRLSSVTAVGREVVVAITKGKLDFGPWEQIFYGEFDGSRSKRVLIKVIGE